MKDYTFPLKTQQPKSKQTYLKSRNQNEPEEKHIKLTDLFELMRSQRTFNHLAILNSSLERKTIEDNYIKINSRYDTKQVVKVS